MSFDLIIWDGPAPADDSEAEDTYNELYARWDVYGENPDRASEPTPAIAKIVAALAARWPDGDESPWASPLSESVAGPYVHLDVVWSKALEVAAVAFELATEHGLVCFEPGHAMLLTTPTTGDAFADEPPANK